MESDSKEMALFAPRTAIRMSYRGTSSRAVPNYPSPGMNIDYYLADTTKDLKIEIMDANGKVVQTFTPPKAKKDTAKKEGVSMATGFGPVGAFTNLKTTPGHHRIHWDMRHVGPWHKQSSRSGRGGPKLLPGSYSMKMSAGGKNMTKNLKNLRSNNNFSLQPKL